ncbi:MAG: rRNA maturation RNase YbeY [Clostridiales bacterium]|nr:rRNA maturation RNase YbeY [Clostridiales bacterium]
MISKTVIILEYSSCSYFTALNLKRLIKRCAKAVKAHLGIKFPIEVNVFLTNDKGIRRINREQRNIDRETDVLSFPTLSWFDGKGKNPTDEDLDFDTLAYVIGDMVLSLERAEEQAREYGHSFKRECAYLSVHSLLHMFGFDHVDEGRRKRLMRKNEEEILAKLKITRDEK